MKQGETIWFNNQEYWVLAAEHPEEESPESLDSGRYVLWERKLKWENRGYPDRDCPYSGGVVIAKELNAIPLTEGYPTCFQYDTVLELIFERGDVTALADHSKAMKKVAKNLEYQLRSLKKRRDVFVIRRFLNKTFIRKYPEKWVKRG